MGGAGWWQWQAEVSYFVTLPPHRVLVFRVVCTDRCSSLLCNSNRATFCDSLTNAHHILLTEEFKSDSDENPTHATYSLFLSTRDPFASVLYNDHKLTKHRIQAQHHNRSAVFRNNSSSHIQKHNDEARPRLPPRRPRRCLRAPPRRHERGRSPPSTPSPPRRPPHCLLHHRQYARSARPHGLLRPPPSDSPPRADEATR